MHLEDGNHQPLFEECCQTYHRWSDSQNSQKRSDILSAGCNKDDRSLSLWALRVHFNTIVWVKTFLTWSNIVHSQKLPQPKDLVGSIFLDPCLRFGYGLSSLHPPLSFLAALVWTARKSFEGSLSKNLWTDWGETWNSLPFLGLIDYLMTFVPWMTCEFP